MLDFKVPKRLRFACNQDVNLPVLAEVMLLLELLHLSLTPTTLNEYVWAHWRPGKRHFWSAVEQEVEESPGPLNVEM